MKLSNDSNADTDLSIRLVEKALANLVKDYQSSPLDFLNEHDVQAVLYGHLRQAYEHARIRLDPIRCKTKTTPSFEGLPFFNPVKAEYSLDTKYSFGSQIKSMRGRVDLAILSPNQKQNATVWYQPARVAIELKLWSPVDGGGPMRDVVKLKTYHAAAKSTDCAFTGISLLVVHPGAEHFLDMEGYEHLRDREAVRMPEDGVTLQIITAKSWEQVNIAGKEWMCKQNSEFPS